MEIDLSTIPIRYNTYDFCFTACNRMEEDIPLQRHNHFEAVVTLRNNYVHTVNGESRRPEPGEVVILRPQDCHSAHKLDGDGEHVCRDFYIEQDLFREACDYISPTLFLTLMSKKDPPTFCFSPEELECFEKSLDFSYLYILGKDYELFQSSKRIVTCRLIGTYVGKKLCGEQALPNCLKKLLLNMQNAPDGQKTVAEMAAESGYSPDYLSKLFRSYFGKSIEQHLIERRIYDSLPKLLHSGKSVEQIARESGWEYSGNYIIHFKRLYGITPARYRRQYINALRGRPLI